MPLRLSPLDDRHQQIVSLLYGPVALFAIEPVPAAFSRNELLAAQRVGNSNAWEISSANGKVRMLPFPEIDNQTYRLYQQIR